MKDIRENREEKLAADIKDTPSVLAALSSRMGEGWTNHGDCNPMDFGGQYLRLRDDTVDIVEVNFDEENTYRVSCASVSMSEIASMGGRVIEFSDASQPEDLAEQVLWILLAWVVYYGGETVCYPFTPKSQKTVFQKILDRHDIVVRG